MLSMPGFEVLVWVEKSICKELFEGNRECGVRDCSRGEAGSVCTDVAWKELGTERTVEQGNFGDCDKMNFLKKSKREMHLSVCLTTNTPRYVPQTYRGALLAFDVVSCLSSPSDDQSAVSIALWILAATAREEGFLGTKSVRPNIADSFLSYSIILG